MQGGRAQRDGSVCSTREICYRPLTMAREIPKSLLLRFAREQRAQAVRAEAIIWRAVRNRRCEGAKFQRQVPLVEYIIDFIYFEHRLIVEIDGPSHEVPQQRLADEERDSWLRERRFRVLRLANELVIASSKTRVPPFCPGDRATFGRDDEHFVAAVHDSVLRPVLRTRRTRSLMGAPMASRNSQRPDCGSRIWSSGTFDHRVATSHLHVESDGVPTRRASARGVRGPDRQ